MARDYQPIRRHSSRLSQSAEGEGCLAAEASGVHLASDDYPEMGEVLRDRPDPGSVITVVGALQGPLTAATYGRPDDPRDEEYNGGPQDTGMYWAEPGQQEWKEEHLGPQEAVPPPPWAPAVMEAEMPPAMASYAPEDFAANVMARLHALEEAGFPGSPVLARLAQIEEARQFFGAPAPPAAPLCRRATTINGTQVDDHGDAPDHGTVPRASAPDSYDSRSTEGDGDPRWSDPVDKKDTEDFNGATVGMYPEGMSAGGGPSLPVGAYVAHYYQQPGQHELEQHLTGEHGVSPADLSALRMRAWNSYPEELGAAHVRVSQGRPLDDWHGERVTGHGRPMSHTDIQDHLYRQHGVMMAGGHSPGELEGAHEAEHANLDFPPGEHHGPAALSETEAPDEYGPDQGDAATWMAHQGPLDPVFGSRVPWTGKERGSLHRWQDVPTGTWGDFVPSDEFPGSGARQSPAAQAEREEERARELSAEAAGQRYEKYDASNPGWQGVDDYHPGDNGFDLNEAEEPDYAKDLDVYNGLATHWEHEDRARGRAHPGWFDHTLSHLAAFGPDPAEEANMRDHLLRHHGWTAENADRAEARGDRFTHMHDTLHQMGMASHVHQDPAEAARQRELSSRFGDPFQAEPRRGHPGQGGTRLADPGEAISNAAPRDWEGMHANMPLRTWSTRAGALDPPHPHDDESSSLDSGPSEGDEGFPESHDDLQSPDDWPLAGADAGSGGPAYTQGARDGHGGRVFPPPPPPPMPAADGDGAPGEDGQPGDGKGKKVQIEVKAHLDAFTAAVADPRFRFEFTAAWSDVVAKAKRIRREGHVRITHASAGMVIGEVRGDHDTYESGLQRPPGKPQTIQHWACGCPWASFHQDKSLGTRYAGRPCSHVMALQYEAQARGMFGKSVARDETTPAWSRRDVVVKSWPPYEGEPHAGHWTDYWLAPSASLHRTATPDEARDAGWTPEQRDAWDSQAGSQDHPHDDSQVACYYQHAGPCPGPGMGRTAESLRHPRPGSFRSEIVPNPDFDPHSYDGGDSSTHVMNGYLGNRLAGQLHFARSDDGQAYHVGMLHTSSGEDGDPKARGKGVASAMMDDLYSHVRQNGQWLDHGTRTSAGNGWWASYREPHPEVNVHHAHPDEGWKDYFSPHEVAMDAASNYANSRGRGVHTRLTWRSADYPDRVPEEKWTHYLGLRPPGQRATAVLIAAGEDLGELIALAQLGGFSALVRTADQANAPWGSENVSKHPPVKPYGATEPLNRDQSPASYGFLSAPDPDNWGGIQDDSAMQMPLTNTAGLSPHVAYPDISDWQPEDQESFGYADRASTAGPSTSITPRDPGGIRMEEARAELHDEPEPALPSTTGDDPQGEGEGLRQLAGIDGTMGDAQDVPHGFTASSFHGGCALCGMTPGGRPHLAAADGTIGGGDAGDGGEDQSPSAVAGLGEFGASADSSGVVRGRPPASRNVREEFRRKFGGTPMGDLARETSPQAQQPSPVGQEPGMGSMDEPLSPDDPSIQTIGNQQWSGGGADSDEVAVPPGEAQGSIDDIVASFQRSAAARQLGGGGGAGAMAGDGDIAGAARQYLSKTADVLPDAEAAELIAEGRGQRARNLSLLRLEGTHYEDEDDDLARRGVSLDDYDDDVISV